jgi:tRNA1Val (adenine37-N6)-methyltransferase
MDAFSRISRPSRAADHATQAAARNRPEIEKLPGETLDTLFDGRLVLAQRRSGYRFSIDALLLAHFVSVQRTDRIVDLGSGNGVIALALAYLHPAATLTGVELQAAMVERAGRSLRWNGLDGRVEMRRGDVRRGDELPEAASFDVAVCNPPYRGAASGRLSAGDERQIARHELHGDLDDFLSAAARLVRNKGRAALIHLAPRAADVLGAMRRVGLEPKRLRWVHSFADSEASLLLVEGVKGGRAGLAVHRPLVLYRAKQIYSAEAAAIIAGGPE